EGTLGAHGSGHGEFRLRRLRMGAKGEGHIQMSRSVIEGRSSQANGLVRLVALFGFALTLAGCSQSKPAPGAGLWDPNAAAAYLDRRMEWGIGWKTSAPDPDPFCFSCHTAVPYALARPALRATLGESAPTAPEQQLMGDVRRRVRLWGETSPFYPDQYVGP